MKKRPKPKKPRLNLAHVMAAVAVLHEKIDTLDEKRAKSHETLEALHRLRAKQDEQMDRIITCHRLMLRRLERFGERVTEQSIRREIRTPTLKVAG